MAPLHILIIGGGLGGLSCAIGCRRKGLEVTVLERDAELTEFGAGIQLPPNAARVMQSYGLLSKLISEGQAFASECIFMHRYDGELLTKRPLRMAHWLAFDQYTIHRVDYQRILAAEAEKLGAKLRFGCKVEHVECEEGGANVTLSGGEVLSAVAIIGADGLFSSTRRAVLQQDLQPTETGDLAWRATLTREQVEASGNTGLINIVQEQRPMGWLGPGSHVAFYPLRGGAQYNLVLARPDDLPSLTTREEGDPADLRDFFSTWDPLLTDILSLVERVQKWKLLHLAPLETWTRGAVALMGDACHPTLPYQAQGAAMAVEDGATLAEILGRLNEMGEAGEVARALKLYERMRKRRTEVNVRGAESNRLFLHLPTGTEMDARDRLLRDWDWEDMEARSAWPYLDPQYARQMMGFDAEAETGKAFDIEFGRPE